MPKVTLPQKMYLLLYPKEGTINDISKIIYGSKYGLPQKLRFWEKNYCQKGYIKKLGETNKGGGIYISTPKLILEKIADILKKKELHLTNSENEKLSKSLNHDGFRKIIGNTIEKVDISEIDGTNLIIMVLDSSITYWYSTLIDHPEWIDQLDKNRDIIKNQIKNQISSEKIKEQINQILPESGADLGFDDLTWIFEIKMSLLEKLKGLTPIGQTYLNIHKFDRMVKSITKDIEC